MANAVPPQEVDCLAGAHTRGRFKICAIHDTNDSGAALRDRYKAIGYRLGGSEPLMVHHLKRIPRATSPAKIERVMTQDVADQVAQAARGRQILPE